MLANRHGIYTQPGAKGISGLLQEEAWTGVKVTQMLDFTPTSSWAQIANPYALDSYKGMGMRLELSVPLLPDDPTTTLEQCASGAYDTYWAALAKNLTVRGLGNSVVRPGWEMNGNWYRWSARGKEADYVGCFRSLVTAMRTVTGQAFLFDWNPAVAADLSDATLTYPGDDYVDVVGLDVYDMSWAWYPVADPDPVAVETARLQVWRYLHVGPRGLAFWSGFGKAHGKPLAVTEWGVTWRSDGHGGGDNPGFIDRMLNWITDPGNNVAYSNYFEIDTTNTGHALTTPGTRFPEAAARYLARAGELTGTR
jgi:hypothetical protein